ncbi:hypothetical protein EV715DRAFT_210112 [Schizophyllum commune]
MLQRHYASRGAPCGGFSKAQRLDAPSPSSRCQQFSILCSRRRRSPRVIHAPRLTNNDLSEIRLSDLYVDRKKRETRKMNVRKFVFVRFASGDVVAYAVPLCLLLLLLLLTIRRAALSCSGATTLLVWARREGTSTRITHYLL